MMNNLTGTQVVLVTGAGSGIGYAIATVLARAGHTVYASLRLTQPEGAKRARTIRSLAAAEKLALQIVDLDCLSEASCRAAVDQILIEQGRIDVFVNKAAMLMTDLNEELDTEQLKRTLH